MFEKTWTPNRTAGCLAAVIVSSFALVAHAADIETFNELSLGTVLDDGTSLEAGFGFQRREDNTTATIVDDGSGNHVLQITESLAGSNATNNGATAFVRDLSEQTLSPSGNSYFRSVDINISSIAGNYLFVGLLDGSLNTLGGNPQETIATNTLVGVSLQSDQELNVLRYSSSGETQAYSVDLDAFTSDGGTVENWSSNTTYRISLVVQDDMFNFSVVDLEQQQVVISGTSDISGSVSASTLRFVVGDPYGNRTRGADFTLDNVSTTPIPEPGTVSLVIAGGLLITFKRLGN